MTVIPLAISDDIVARFPDVAVTVFGAALASCTDPKVDTRSPIDPALGKVQDHPYISAWRKAIGACGLKPSLFKGSAEQLTRRFLTYGPLDTGMPIVDLYCNLSVRHLVPFGAYDPERLPGRSLTLRSAAPTDTFDPIGGGSFDLKEEVVVYASGDTVCCYAWNHRDSNATCVTEHSTTAIFLGEAVTLDQRTGLATAIKDLKARFSSTTDLVTLDASQRRAVLDLSTLTGSSNQP